MWCNGSCCSNTKEHVSHWVCMPTSYISCLFVELSFRPSFTMTMILPILVSAGKLKKCLAYHTEPRTKTHEQSKNSKRKIVDPLVEEVCPEYLWCFHHKWLSIVKRIYHINKFSVWSQTVKEWWTEKVKSRKIRWIQISMNMWNIVHEMKQDVDSRDEGRHTENSD